MVLISKKGKCPMMQNMNEQKAKLKKVIEKEIDDYFATVENSSNESGFDINRFEQLMLENQRNLKNVMKEANSSLISSVYTGVKKTVQNAETH
jgi:predicted house-cleaning NTP pyrophosphatase (Maf/HAM1 superfamily)